MAVYDVFSYPLFVRYRTNVCSKATCFYILTNVLTLVLPLLITYHSQGFWKKLDFYREQPNVSFKHKMFLVLETKSPNELIFWSTYENLNRIVSPEIMKIRPLIEHREEDFDMDGKRDELQMTIEIPVLSQEILSVKLILIFDYELYLFSEFHMECAAFVHYSSSLPGAALNTFGELSMNQRQPLSHTGTDERYNYPVIDISRTEQSVAILENILLQYLKRNITTSVKNLYHIWEAGPAVNESSFKINLVIMYPEETIMYKVGFWQLIKWALVQYMAIFIIINYIFQKMKNYVFQKRIISTIVVHPLKQKL